MDRKPAMKNANVLQKSSRKNKILEKNKADCNDEDAKTDQEYDYKVPIKIKVTTRKLDISKRTARKLSGTDGSSSRVKGQEIRNKCVEPSAVNELDDVHGVVEAKSKSEGLQSSTGEVCDPKVANWIKGLNLKDSEKYIKLFGEQEIDMEALRLINEHNLRTIGITAVGPLNKLMQAIRNLRGETFERYLEQFDTSPGQPLNEKAKSKIKTTINQMSDGTETTSVGLDDKKGASLDMIPVKEPRKTKVKKNTFLPKDTISFENKKREKMLDIKRTAREKMQIHQKVEREKVLKTKADVPVQNQDFEGDTAVGLYGQDVSSAEPTPRLGTAVQIPTVEISRNPWSSQVKPDSSVKPNAIATKVQDLKRCTKTNEAMTEHMIEKLQNQLRTIQVTGSTRNRELEVTAHGQDKSVVSNLSKQSEIRQPLFSTRMSSPHSSPVVLKSMTKHELMSEVRKQKQEYNKQLKTLESELKGLMKRTDPVKSCELPIEDVFFSEEDLIGEGAFSKVYRGSFQGVEVAVKRLSVPLDRHDKNYFSAEVSLLRELRHPHVVLLVGVSTSTNLPLMVLEYLAGGSLYKAIHHTATPPFDHVAYHNIAKDIALGMNYLHRHRPSILHLDLKSMNVLLTLHDRAKIADFGFSKLRHEADMAASRQGKGRRTVRGTPAWMAPEMLSGGEVTIKADVYSFGMILWEMFAREHPYDGLTTFQVLECLRTNKRPAIPCNCPASLADLITSCWSHNPAKRLQFKDILIKLDNLAFPPEWRSLFDAANVPQLVLEDIESAREIVGFVNKTLERDLEHSQRNEKDLPVPLLDLKLIDLDDEEELSDPSEQSPHIEHDIKSLDSWESDSSDKDTAMSGSDRSDQLTPGSESASSGCENLLPTSDQEISSELVKPTLCSERDDRKSTNIPIPPLPPTTSVHFTTQNIIKPASKLQQTAESEPKVRAEDLVAQRQLLRSTTEQHPSQLKDLKDLPAETFNSIAMILKQAVEKRRLAMKDGPIYTDRSTEGGMWSTAESSRRDTLRIDET